VNAALSSFAILFADVTGSTSLYERLGDERALAVIELVLGELRKSVAIQRGRVIKTIGDEVMAVLPSADAAMQAGCDMQIRIAAIPKIEAITLSIRVGFHFGPAIEEGGDVFGDAVNTAARMTGVAKGGQIITSRATVEALSPLLRAGTRELDAITVKGKQDEIRIYEVIWQDSGDLTTLGVREPAASMSEPMLILSYRGQTMMVGADRQSVSLGREADNDLVVNDMKASRSHCRIEYRRGKFFLIDQSSNGTYVTVEGDIQVMLKREEFLLRGKGVISLGYFKANPGPDVVSFACD
jgi:adenylate cyclase